MARRNLIGRCPAPTYIFRRIKLQLCRPVNLLIDKAGALSYGRKRESSTLTSIRRLKSGEGQVKRSETAVSHFQRHLQRLLNLGPDRVKPDRGHSREITPRVSPRSASAGACGCSASKAPAFHLPGTVVGIPLVNGPMEQKPVNELRRRVLPLKFCSRFGGR